MDPEHPDEPGGWYEYMLRVTDMPPILGVMKQRCSQLAARDDFPEPVVVDVRGRRLWRRGDVERWRDERWPRPWQPEG